MYWAKQKHIAQVSKAFNMAVLMALILPLLWHGYLAFQPERSPAELWWSDDQRAAQHWQQGQYLAAARLYASQLNSTLSISESSALRQRAAIAYYAAEDFAGAEALMREQHSGQGYLAWGNSLAHQERYDEAIIAYRMALEMRAAWPAAEHNLALMRILQDKPLQRRENDQDTQSDFAADDIRFDLDNNNSEQQVDDALANGDLSEAALQRLWLRQLNRRPVDFLQRKFAYQWQQQEQQ